jgi:hypothetical protein
MTIYRITKWSEVYETAESRRHKVLQWVSMPIGFSSAGYQLLLDEFGPRAASIYGAWCALVAFAATCPVRGMLCTSKGVAIKVSHINRTTGLDCLSVFEELLRWAASPEVAWLEAITEAEASQLLGLSSSTAGPNPSRESSPVACSETQENPGDSPSPSHCPGHAQATTGLPHLTSPHLTRPNKTQHHPTSPDQTEPDQAMAVGGGLVVAEEILIGEVDLAEACQQASKLRKATQQLDLDFIWQSAVIADALAPGLLADVVSRLRETGPSRVSKPKGYIESVLRRECQERGLNLNRMRALCPPNPATVARQAVQ